MSHSSGGYFKRIFLLQKGELSTSQDPGSAVVQFFTKNLLPWPTYRSFPASGPVIILWIPWSASATPRHSITQTSFEVQALHCWDFRSSLLLGKRKEMVALSVINEGPRRFHSRKNAGGERYYLAVNSLCSSRLCKSSVPFKIPSLCLDEMHRDYLI